MIKNLRHRAREAALQVLYRIDVTSSTTDTALPSGKALSDELTHHFQHFDVPDGSREFAAKLVAGTLQDRETLDTSLEKHASNWKVSRMGFVDRSLLRMAAYELKNCPEIDAAVTIDEAIELGKQFGTAETPAFINGILDSIRKEFSDKKSDKPDKKDDGSEGS